MSKAKTELDIQAYLNTLNNQGYLNDWRSNPDEDTTSITTAATDTNKTFQNVDSMMRRQKDRLTNNPNRKAIVCSTEDLTTWEGIVHSFGEVKNKDEPITTQNALTRNA